jgi:hypothetical protein
LVPVYTPAYEGLPNGKVGAIRKTEGVGSASVIEQYFARSDRLARTGVTVRSLLGGKTTGNEQQAQQAVQPAVLII